MFVAVCEAFDQLIHHALQQQDTISTTVVAAGSAALQLVHWNCVV